MLISNINLYKAEWLDVVFNKRNKEYGAYDIRRHYSENLTKALLIAVVTVVGAFVAVGAAIKVEPGEVFKRTEVDNSYKYVEPPVKAEPEKPKPETAPSAKKADPIKTVEYTTLVAAADETSTEPPTIKQLEAAAVGSETIDAPGTGINTPVNANVGSGGEGKVPDGATESTEVVTTEGLTVMPAPVGGTEGWTKFLKKNLRYPAQAVDEGKSGKVWISFIIEKDGSLTEIKVLRGPGYGMDEEAMRVLRKAPAWTPGIQRNKPVRVQYTLPINFALE